MPSTDEASPLMVGRCCLFGCWLFYGVGSGENIRGRRNDHKSIYVPTKVCEKIMKKLGKAYPMEAGALYLVIL